ncbi:YmiA family putative membrane protein [Atlantibacter hermannii]|uniref:YmiA family putative membrane protein n=1 Tax=Atlantibacter hermannii TaxID=565 RepID=UPI0009BB886A|nr:YmiA family putative membrane protein [Enterobacteriaceae bacterium]
MISNVDCVRIAMPQGSHEPERDPALKRKAWLAVFALSALFWLVVGGAAWYFWG